MAKMSNGEAVAVGCIVGFLGLLLIVFIIGLSVVIFGGLAMLLMNVILPLFDVNYPLTYTQAGGVGLGLVAVRAMLSGLFSVTVNK